jgi:PAS domain S-box-containing protein
MKAVTDQVALAIERKKTVETLRKSREKLEQRVEERTYELRRQAELLDLARDAIIVRDAKGKITFWSSGAEKVYGWTKREATGKPTHRLLFTKFPVPLKDIMETTFREGRWEGELVHTTKDKRKITVLSRWALEKNNETGSVIFLEINSDITERKQAEDALRLTGIYNRNLIEASLDPLVTISAEGKISDVNTATELVTGYSRNDLIGTDFSDYFTDPRKARTGYKLVFKEGFVHDYELEIRHRDGHITPVIYSASVYRDKAGRVKGVFAAARDITKRKEAEEELVRLAAAVEQSADGITITDPKGTVLYANSSFLAQIGYSRAELIDQNIEIVRSGKDAESVYRDMREKTEHGKVWAGEVTNRKKDDMLYDAYMTVSPVKDPSGRIINYVSIINDITEKKRFDKHLQEAQKMQAIGTLAGGVAHDFNNIIAGVIGFTEMVLEDIPAESPSQRRLQLVLKGAYRGRDLVRQILAFSRKGEHEKQLVSLNHVVEEVSLLLRASLPTTIEIRKNLALKSDTIMADQTQIHQVIINLCSNAAHAMRGKGGMLNIELADESLGPEDNSIYPESKPGRYVRLTISDTGCGIEQEHIDHIFEPFFTTKAPGEGTGLGLSVVHGIIKNHDGFVKVYSRPGKGSAFHVFLPEAKNQHLSETTEIDSFAGGEESILLVDDEELLVEMGQQRLERLGYKTVGATDALRALEIFRADPDMFHLVITDYTMPQMTGLDLSMKLFRIRPDIPIIMCSGLNDPVPMEKLKKAGIKRFITKPFGKKEFSQTVRSVLDKQKTDRGK